MDFTLLKQDPEGTPHHVQFMDGQGMVTVFTLGREGWNDFEEVQINSFNFFLIKMQIIVLPLLNIATYIE